MELNEIVSYIGFGLVGIVIFFLKGIISDVKHLKDDKAQSLVTQLRIDSIESHLNKVESTMFKKFTGVHTREEKQREVNQELHTMLARIEGKLDQALKTDGK